MPTAVSLFTGCGGSDSGLVKAGFDILMANDILPYAQRVYKANLPETDFKLCNITKIKSFPSADLLAGCYPCQGFSVGGVRDPNRGINYLYREFDRALRIIRPKAFIVENVPGMKKASFRHLLNNQIIRFRLAGYKVSKPTILDARNYGLAQERKRLFIVGIRSDFGINYQFPKPSHGPDGKRPYLTQKDVIGDMPKWPDGEFCEDEFHWYYLSRNRYRGWKEQSKTIVAQGRHLPLHPMSPKLVKFGDDDWRFEKKGPARRLSYREAARLQGFGKSFRFPGGVSVDMKCKVIGNSVPPPLFKAIAKEFTNIW